MLVALIFHEYESRVSSFRIVIARDRQECPDHRCKLQSPSRLDHLLRGRNGAQRLSIGHTYPDEGAVHVIRN